MKRKRRPEKRAGPFRWFLRILTVLILSGLISVMYGLPGAWVTGILNRMDQVPGRVELSTVRWMPGQGWILDEVRWFSPRDLTRSLLEVSQLTLRLSIPGKPVGFRIDQGAVQTEAGVWIRDLSTRQPLNISNISGEVDWTKEQLTFSAFHFTLSGLEVSVEGGLLLPETVPPPVPGKTSDLAAEFLRPLIPILEGLESFSSTKPPLLNVDVGGRLRNPELQLTLFHPQVFTLRGASFTSVQVAGRLEDNTLSIHKFEVKAGEQERLQGSSQIDFRDQYFDVHLENTLGRDSLEALSPFSLDAFLSTLQVRVEGQTHFDLQIGPSPFQKPGERITGSFQVKEASYRDAFFPELEFDLELNNTTLLFPEFSGVLGAGDKAGTVSGNLQLDNRHGLFRMKVEGAAHPDQVVSLVGPQVESLLREWEFRGEPPAFKLEIDTPSRQSPLQVYLLTRAEDAVWRGTLFHQIRAVTTLDKDGLRVREVMATRGPHSLEGGFEFPRDLQSCTFTLESSFPLPDILPLLGQKAVDVIRPVRFLGDSRFSASGFVDLSGEHRHRLSGEAAFERAVINWVLFDEISSTFALENQQLELPDVAGKLVEGGLTGRLRVINLFEPTARFDAAVQVKNVDLFELITTATDRVTTPYTGTLRLDLQLKGALWDTLDVRRVNTFEGEGEVEIREGELFRIPLLLGLSNILGKVIKGFGYASQGDFDADFLVRNGKISSDNIFLGGTLISIAGEASYEMDSRNLDGNVKVQLLKDGFMSDALKLLLWPIRKLIEVHLTGTLDDPDWRPRNLPKELFGK